MSISFRNSILGVPVQCYENRRNSNGNSVGTGLSRRSSRKCVIRANNNDWVSKGVKFSHFCGRNVELLWKNIGLRSGMMVNCVKDPIVKSKTLVRTTLAPVWEEGLLIVRCSVFCAVMSGVCLLLWYGQVKAKSFVETKLLPSVCAALSEHIQRDLDFGKVRRISPLSITLESCSFGPHVEEFSCGEVPTIKLRVLPFASLRRGKIVVDAVLHNPSLLVVQKKNYTWMGIPFTDGIVPRRLSTEEGIDHRTKTRRIAREDAFARMVQERDNAAIEAAKMGYIFSDGSASSSEFGMTKAFANNPTGLATSEPIFCMDERLHWRDHHCMDAGVEYDMKHADLEKSFGVNTPGSGIKFWPKLIPGPIMRKFKRRANWRDISAAGISAKTRILERSASAAHAYFLGVSQCGDPNNLSKGNNVMNLEEVLPKQISDTTGAYTCISNSLDDMAVETQTTGLNTRGNRNNENIKFEGDGSYLTGKETLNVDSNMENITASTEISENHILSEGNHHNDITMKASLNSDPSVSNQERVIGDKSPSKNLSSVRDVAAVMEVKASDINKKIQGVAFVNEDMDIKDKSSVQSGQVLEYEESNSEDQGFPTSQILKSLNPDPLHAVQHSDSVWPWSLESGLNSFSSGIGEFWSSIITLPFQRLKSEFSPKVKDIVAELVEKVDEGETLSIEKMLPITLDSVHFKNGTLMLLAYGDNEPR